MSIHEELADLLESFDGADLDVVAAVILDRFAVVELPEERENGTYVDVSVFAGEIRIRTGWADADTARSIASQLLRAADQLENLS